MLKILQARLQQYMNSELPDVQAGFRKGRGTREKGSSPHRECAEVYGSGVDTPWTPEQVSPAPEGLCPLWSESTRSVLLRFLSGSVLFFASIFPLSFTYGHMSSPGSTFSTFCAQGVCEVGAKVWKRQTMFSFAEKIKKMGTMLLHWKCSYTGKTGKVKLSGPGRPFAMLSSKQITSKDLLCSTGNTAQYSVIT